MIIIVEGISRVGKTTLCNKLKNKFGFPIYKHNNKIVDYSKMKDDVEKEKMMCMIDVYKTIPSNIIFDRFHFSNAVYGILLRNYDKNRALNNIKEIEEYLNAAGKVILIKVSPTDLKESSKQYKKDLAPFESLMEELYDHSVLKKYECNYITQENLINTLIEEFI